MTLPADTRVRPNALTVDVEEWFHICGVDKQLGVDRWEQLPARVVETTRWLLDDLNAAGVRATCFVVGWVAHHYPGLVAEIAAAGHEIGSHGYVHGRAYDLGPARFLDDLRKSVRALQTAGVREIFAYRAPEWSINDRSLWALDVLVRSGFTMDASMAPIRIVGNVRYPRHPYIRKTAVGPIAEFPPTVTSRFGQVMPLGWGWGLRMSSPSRVLREIDQLNHAGLPAVLTVHPWEIDANPPRVSLPAKLQFAHYFCLAGFRQRLASVLRHGGFGALSDLATCP